MISHPIGVSESTLNVGVRNAASIVPVGFGLLMMVAGVAFAVGTVWADLREGNERADKLAMLQQQTTQLQTEAHSRMSEEIAAQKLAATALPQDRQHALQYGKDQGDLAQVAMIKVLSTQLEAATLELAGARGATMYWATILACIGAWFAGASMIKLQVRRRWPDFYARLGTIRARPT